MTFRRWVGIKKLNLDKEIDSRIPEEFKFKIFNKRVSTFLKSLNDKKREALENEWKIYKGILPDPISNPKPERIGSMDELYSEIYGNEPTTEITTKHLDALKRNGDYEKLEEIEKTLKRKKTYEEMGNNDRILKLFSTLMSAIKKIS
jgi:hypothetical protein